MKKYLAIFLVATLLVSVSTVFVSADADLQNVALGKAYTKTGVNPEANQAPYFDTDDKQLTDGAKVPENGDPNADQWVAFHSGSPDYAEFADDPDILSKIQNDITIDLGGEYELSKFSYQYMDGLWGIAGPAELEIFVDGVSVGKATKGSASIDEAVLVLDEPVVGRKVTFTSKFAAHWIFVSEVEVFAKGSGGSGNNPATGDTFVIFSIIALISCAGAFVAVKAKR